MSNFWTGHKGVVKINTVSLPTIKWAYTSRARIPEITNSGSAFVAQYLGDSAADEKLVKEFQGTCTALWDSTALRESMATPCIAGREIQLSLTYGASTKARAPIYAVIEEVTEEDDNQQGVIQFTFTWKGNSSEATAKPPTPA